MRDKKSLVARIFNFDYIVSYTERVGKYGCMLPILHFILLPFSLGAYVVNHFLGGKLMREVEGDQIQLSISKADYYGFSWLLSFWGVALLFAIVALMLYRFINKTYHDLPITRAALKAIMGFVLSSGLMEKFIANVAMPKFLGSTRRFIDTAYAPKFEYSLYSDLGGLVRSSAWLPHEYSLLSFYSNLPLYAFIVMTVCYIGKRVREELATRPLPPR